MIVRIKRITISNLNNVSYGQINLSNQRSNASHHYDASIMGLYGQNGSGKTTIVEALNIIKHLMMGKEIPSRYLDIIQSGKASASIEIDFSIIDESKELLNIQYAVTFARIEKEIQLDDLMSHEKEYRLGVIEEHYSMTEWGKNSFEKLIVCDLRDDGIFTPKTKLNVFTGDSEKAKKDLFIAKKVSYEKGTSFIFSGATLRVFRDNCLNDQYKNVLIELASYANYNLFVIETRNDALIYTNIGLPINFKINVGNQNSFALGSFAIPFNGLNTRIPARAFPVVKKSFESINIVLEKLIPGLRVQAEEVGRETTTNGEELIQVHFASLRNGKKISLVNESSGIKKIISILQLLIVMYNNPTTTVVIDEIDSGVFEYLLGELLRIISNQARGQLLFTAHNLRALETIDKSFVYFTTTNPENRYIKMTYVNKNNNLRDFYFHEILLNGQKEELYDLTQNGAIALAFREAGESI